MHWIVILIIILLLIYSPPFRKFSKIIGIILIPIIVLGIAGIYIKQQNASAKREASKKLISTSEIEVIESVIYGLGTDRYPRLKGRIRNNSKSYSLTEVTFQISVVDVPVDVQNKRVDKVGEGIADIRVVIPPGQARDFATTIYSLDIKPRGKLEWSYQILGTMAK